MEFYHGPFGERLQANDAAGEEFLRSYRKAAEKMGHEGKREAMAMLALVVLAAGGKVVVPFGIRMLGTGGVSLTVSHDPTDSALILEARKE